VREQIPVNGPYGSCQDKRVLTPVAEGGPSGATVRQMATRDDVRQRHREQRESTRRRILAAAVELLEERPWSEVTLETLARRADLTRTALYRHFPDQQALLLAVIDDVGLTLGQVPGRWERGEGDPVESIRAALRDLVAVFERHGRLLQAIADAATQDPKVAAVYCGLGARLSASVARRLHVEADAGRSDLMDVEEVAAALVWMNERYLLLRFGRHPLADPERASSALFEVWRSTVYHVNSRRT
jgi:AcrR family transcriptional regulator